MPIDHISLDVPEAKFSDMINWLTAANAPLGFKEHSRPFSWLVAMGEEHAWFWLAASKDLNAPTDQLKALWRRQHIAFAAANSSQVDKWYTAAIEAGGEDNGAPGPREIYGPGYYGAFVRDPVLGINFEAVCHKYDPPGE